MFREFVVAKQRGEDDHDRDVALAWRIDALRRHKKLPSLKSLLVSGRRNQKQTPKQMRTALHLLAAQYGGEVRTLMHAKKDTRGR